MDVFGHALITFIIFHRVEWVWAAVILSVFPDIMSNGPIVLHSLITKGKFLTGRVAKTWFARFWRPMYKVTHGLLAPALIGWGLSVLYGGFYWPILGWFGHVVLDIPLHNDREGGAVRFLWPFSNKTVQGVTWWRPRMLVAIWAVLAVWGVIVLF